MEKVNFMQKIQEITKQAKNTKPCSENKTYECTKCKDTLAIWIDDKTTRPCECIRIKRAKKLLQESEVAEKLKLIDFNKIIPKNEDQVKAYNKCKLYLDNYKGKNLAMIGQSGSGKTHFTLGVMKELIETKLEYCLYISYRELVTKLNQNRFDETSYYKILNTYKNTDILVIDDLFKLTVKNGVANVNELQPMFELINYRYNNNKPIIFSTELLFDELKDVDEAIASRLLENAKDENNKYAHVFKRDSKNLRY